MGYEEHDEEVEAIRTLVYKFLESYKVKPWIAAALFSELTVASAVHLEMEGETFSNVLENMDKMYHELILLKKPTS